MRRSTRCVRVCRAHECDCGKGSEDAQQTAFLTLSSSFTSVGHEYSQGIFHLGDSIDNKARSQNIRGLFLKVSRVVINCAQHSQVTRTGGSEPNQRVQFPYILSLSFVEACTPTTLFHDTDDVFRVRARYTGKALVVGPVRA